MNADDLGKFGAACFCGTIIGFWPFMILAALFETSGLGQSLLFTVCCGSFGGALSYRIIEKSY
jgi:hypothetical protein